MYAFEFHASILSWLAVYSYLLSARFSLEEFLFIKKKKKNQNVLSKNCRHIGTYVALNFLKEGVVN